MRSVLIVATVLTMLAGAAWSADPPWTITYDGSAKPTAGGAWTVYKGSDLSNVSDGICLIDDVGSGSDRMRFTAGAGIVPTAGATVESRARCGSYAESGTYTPMNLGLNIPTGGGVVAHWLTIKTDRITMANHLCTPGTEIAGDYTQFKKYRLCYKRQSLNTRMPVETPDSWAVYVDDSQVPSIFSWTNNSTTEGSFNSPVWGAGGGAPTQQIYFDYINFTDGGAYPPGMDGSVAFVGGDPDGTFLPGGTSFRITWQTNLPGTAELHYSVEGDTNYFGQVATDTNNSTSHSVTVSGVSASNIYYFYTVTNCAAGAKAISLPVRISSPFRVISGPSAAVAADRQSATISWTTSLADGRSEVHYGLDETCSSVVVESGSGGLTSHSVTIPTEIGKLYYYYVKSSNATYGETQSAVQAFNTSLLDNAGFENGAIGPWVKFAGSGADFDGIRAQPFYAVPAHTGSYMVGSAENGQSVKDHAGCFQVASGLTPGRWYEAKAWLWTRRQAAHEAKESYSYDVAGRIGLDPTGGTNPGEFVAGVWVENPSVTWSGWHESENSCTDVDQCPVGIGGPWKPISVYAKATGSQMTVFLQHEFKWALEWNIAVFDDVLFYPIAVPSDIAGAKAHVDGYPVAPDGKVVTAVWPDEKRFYIEEPSRSAGILVFVDDVLKVPGLGTLVKVEGRIDTMGDPVKPGIKSRERYIFADTVTPQGQPDEPITPLGLSNVALGGGPAGLLPGMSDRGSGASNVGLLCTIYGRVLEDPDMVGQNKAEFYPDLDPLVPDYDLYERYHMYVDDGSGVLGGYRLFQSPYDYTWVNFGRYKGVKVYYHMSDSSYLPMPGDYVICTGISGIEASDSNWTDPFGDIMWFRTLEVRTDSFESSGPPDSYGDILVWPAGTMK